MRDEKEEEAFRELFEAVKTLGIILQHAKKRNEFIIKPATKGCDIHLAISEGEKGIHSHIKNERASPKSGQRYTNVREIPERDLVSCFLESLDECGTRSATIERNHDDIDARRLETITDAFMERVIRPSRNRQVWVFQEPVGTMFSQLVRTNDGPDRITWLSRMIAESKRLPQIGGLTRSNEKKMWKNEETIAVNKSGSRMIMVLDETTVLDLSLTELKRLVTKVSDLMGLGGLRNAIRPTPENDAATVNPHHPRSGGPIESN
jgi:hypothetical protein